MKDGVALSLVLPCYNEAEIFEESVARIVEVMEASSLSYEVIFVEDKSRDHTADLVRGALKKNKKFRAIFHPTNRGRGATVADGIRAARGKVVGFIDIDCEVSPVYIPEMVRLILTNETDVAVGNRIYRTGLASIHREILSAGYRWLANVMIGTGRIDTESGYKFFDRKKILPVLSLTKHPGWFWDTEIVVLAKRAGLRVIAHPVLFLRRSDKISTVNVIEDTIDYLQSLWRFRQQLYKS
jgi:glycosyltransferase involved in cell wall biosynthesis